jgi:hypothetical protein
MRWINAEAMLDIADGREGTQYFQEDRSCGTMGIAQMIYGVLLYQALFPAALCIGVVVGWRA